MGDGLGWGSEVLFICLNDTCPVFLNGWEKIEQQYGHHASYRYMELPDSKEKNYMMVGNSDAFKACVINKEELLAQNKHFQKQKEMRARLKSCIEEKDITPALFLVLDEAASIAVREEALACLVPLNDLTCIDPIRNHRFRDSAFEAKINTAINTLLKNNFKKECPYCSEIIKAQAKKCMHCREDLS